jgi:phosphoglycerate kinase
MSSRLQIPRLTRLKLCPATRMPIAMKGLDIGPLTVTRFREALRDAATVLWNGPVGMFERTPFATGTLELARIMAAHPGFTIAAGTDTAAAVRQAGVAAKIGYVSTAGTAFLEGLEGRKLPGVAALTEASYLARRGRICT